MTPFHTTATEVANISQLTLCIRWVDDNLDCHEDFIGLHSLDVANTDTILAIIKDVILEWISIRKIVGAMLWWLFNDKGRKDWSGKANKIRGTEDIAYLLLHRFFKLSSSWRHQGQKSDEKLPLNNARDNEAYKEVTETRWQVEKYENDHWTRGSKWRILKIF